jgi:hypothetical protein
VSEAGLVGFLRKIFRAAVPALLWIVTEQIQIGTDGCRLIFQRFATDAPAVPPIETFGKK